MERILCGCFRTERGSASTLLKVTPRPSSTWTLPKKIRWLEDYCSKKLTTFRAHVNVGNGWKW